MNLEISEMQRQQASRKNIPSFPLMVQFWALRNQSLFQALVFRWMGTSLKFFKSGEIFTHSCVFWHDWSIYLASNLHYRQLTPDNSVLTYKNSYTVRHSPPQFFVWWNFHVRNRSRPRAESQGESKTVK